MNGAWFFRSAGCLLAVLLLAPCGCGEVDVPAEEDAPQLKLLNRYPQEGENDAPADLVAIATFSHEVPIGEQGTTAVNNASFTLTRDDEDISCMVYASDLDEMNATAILEPGEALAAGEYELCLSEQIRGTTEAGKPTKALGQVMCIPCESEEPCDLRVCEVYEPCDEAQNCNCVRFTVQ